MTSWKKFNQVVKTGNFYDISDKNNPDDVNQVHFSTFNYFGYFNRINLFNSDEDKDLFSFMFSKELLTNCLVVFYKEVEEMVKIIVDYLGTDSNDRGYFNESEIDENNHWCGRIWDFGDFQYRLVKDKVYFQFYYDFKIDNPFQINDVG
ncbi:MULTISPECIES: hypothetical protein [Chryseobacterium]|uniref:hypothetical protein n=1 Tax=Chryseobacterium TaxID=59732 RepID=UPI001296D103|nr:MULTISPECIES: hypothetical protein [Chryseobacterium]MDR6921312.1 hypothetical protein [Chryseobacterium sp. 2987]